ncbi:hypothetical protein AVEN_89300-1 [Araneus ventricosus]|uniref:Uncharacterized protein n=1 Tax=Araneus ventricosus TaxID=182803 RepID=A0A4Y2K5J8_ARAVE|nr:hypothetical protein AVEN_89300-1 [Araneus ventricosus]
MKPFDFKYGRKQETDEEKEENMILMEESEDEDFGYFQQKWRLRGNPVRHCLFVLIFNLGGARIKAHYSYICGIQQVDGGQYDMTGLRTTNLAKSKCVSVVNDKLANSELKAIHPDRIFEVDCRKELSGF